MTLATIRAAERPGLRPLVVFLVVALGGGGTLFAVSTRIDPEGPFLIAGVYGGLALPALLLTYREAGAAGVRSLLRRCVRLPRTRWWLAAAALVLPVTAWTLGAALGGAQPITVGSAGFYLGDLVIGVAVVNLAEELGWTGFFQHRAMARWGSTSGSLVTAVFFTAIHVPLAVAGVDDVHRAVANVLLVGGLATGIRLLIGRVYSWTGGSLLVVAVLHSSFNASESLLDPAYDWVRIATTVAVSVVVVAFAGRRPGGEGSAPRKGHPLRASEALPPDAASSVNVDQARESTSRASRR